MKIQILTLTAFSMLMFGCASDSGKKADDTDRSVAADQQAKATDQEITQKIRRFMAADDKLSMSAKNVTITTSNRVVTLQGVVTDEGERARVVIHAAGVVGGKQVYDLLEIAPM